MNLSALIWFGLAQAAREPKDYRVVQEQQAAESIASLGVRGALDQALSQGNDALRKHPKSALIRYEMGLACNRAEQIEKALSYYNDALLIDPNMVSALFDRAELRLMNDDVAGAKSDLTLALDNGSSHWGVFLRLSEISGREHNNDAMSNYLIEAVEHGFKLQSLSALGEPWRGWISDPLKSRVIRRVVLLYAKEELWDQLQQ